MPESNPIKISVLVAARNEEHNIERCLQSLDEVSFPKEKLEIIIGDDDSDDRTAEKVLNFIKDKPHFKYIKIKTQCAGPLGTSCAWKLLLLLRR
jgi:glycosyltransferase involved in cell wall biosynthesis